MAAGYDKFDHQKYRAVSHPGQISVAVVAAGLIQPTGLHCASLVLVQTN